jgi:hypothetical protein
MATILLLTMVTFVLCTGTRGDFGEWIMGLFGRRQGSPLAKVGGRNIYAKEMTDFKERRNLANDFMKRAGEMAYANLETIAKSTKLPADKRELILNRANGGKIVLQERLSKPRYFGSGVKLDELVDFQVWLLEADRLGITLLPDDVKRLLDLEFRFTEGDDANFHPAMMYAVMRELRTQSSYRMPSEAMVMKALTDEFRVRIAQLALEYADGMSMRRQTREKFYSYNPEVRMPLSPGMLWDIFKANRSEFSVKLLPIAVDDFVNQVPEPTEEQLKKLFEEHKKDAPNPAAPTPGFQLLASTRIEMVVGDPRSPKFKQWSKAAVLMEATPPAWIPSSPLTTLARYVGGPLAQRARLEQVYDTIKRRLQAHRTSFEPADPRDRRFLAAPWTAPDVYLAIAEKLAARHPEAAASWIAGYAQAQPFNCAIPQLGYAAFGAAFHPKELAAGLAVEAKERVPHYAALVLAGSIQPGFQTLATIHELNKEKFFPLDVVREELTDILERKRAQTWVNANMNELRKRLEEFDANKAKYEREIANNLDKLGLERYVTKDFVNQFTVDKAPELQRLRKAFEKAYPTINITEGRDRAPETMLKEGDFYKLFFESTEPVRAADATYSARPWPPVVTAKKGFGAKAAGQSPELVDLFKDAEQPILFWRIDKKASQIPESLSQVRQRVEETWKFLEARKTKALPRAKEIADELQKSDVGVEPVVALLNLKREPIVLQGLANMYTKDPYRRVQEGPAFSGTLKRDYATFEVSKEQFSYPRDDMAKQILSLRDLKQPIVMGDAKLGIYNKLDEYNKVLFENGRKRNQIVQILTNKPQSMFYVAWVQYEGAPSSAEFQSVLKFALPPAALHPFQDTFFDRAFEMAGKEQRQALMQQLRTQTDSKLEASGEERERFDANESL